jgi:hypothetical protein
VKQNLKGRSLFQLINRKTFDALVTKWEMDKWVQSFSTWEMTQALISCFVLRLNSFREVESSLGIPDSTFGDALQGRSYGFFQELCDLVLLEIRAKTADRKTKKAVRHLLAIDSTEIKVHGSLFDQPGWKQKHCKEEHRAVGKLHVVWNIDGQWIDDFIITPGRRGDSPVSLQLRLIRGQTYVFDRAYNDFSFWEKIVQVGSHFVTRLKDHPRLRMMLMKMPDSVKEKDGVLYDDKYAPLKEKSIPLRHVIYRDPLTKKIFHFITSNFKVAASTVAAIYKKRWAVELLFRWLKGHLDIRRLPTKTPNSVKTQLAAAVLVQLLLQLKKILDKFSGTLWDLLRTIRTGFAKRILAESDPPDDCRWNPASVAGTTS